MNQKSGNNNSKKWVVVHEYGAPSHYAALKEALNQVGAPLRFFELNFFNQAKAIVLGRPKNQWAKTKKNIAFVCRNIFTGGRDLNVVLGLAPFNPYLLVIRWILRNSTINLHVSWPHWDGTRQPHSPLIQAVDQAWELFLHRQVNHVFIATNTAKQNLENSHYSSNAITVVAHSYDSDIFSPDLIRPAGPKRLVYVGRLEASKGVKLMLEIAARMPEYQMVFIGKGPLQSLVKNTAKSQKNVTYLGQISDKNLLVAEMRSCQVLLLPSIRVEGWEEAFGMVLIEGMACGLIPLTTDHVGPTEILGVALHHLCFSEQDFIAGVCKTVSGWSADPNEFQRTRAIALEISRQYRRELIAKRWSTALNLKYY